MPSYISYLSHFNIVWSFTHNCHLNRIYFLQKRANRALTNSEYHAHFAPLFAKLKILDMLVFLRSMSLNLCSAIIIIRGPSVSSKSITGGQVHTYATRFETNHRPNFCRTNIKQLHVTTWNSFPALSVSSSTTSVNFKKRLYDFLSRSTPSINLPNWLYSIVSLCAC